MYHRDGTDPSIHDAESIRHTKRHFDDRSPTLAFPISLINIDRGTTRDRTNSVGGVSISDKPVARVSYIYIF